MKYIKCKIIISICISLITTASWAQDPLLDEIPSGEGRQETWDGYWKYYGGNSTVKQDRQDGFDNLKKASDKGSRFAMYCLSRIYCYPWSDIKDGDSLLKENLRISFKYCRESANQRYPLAECLLGVKYFQGEGTPVNVDSAFFWFKRAIDDSEKRMEMSDMKYKHTFTSQWVCHYYAFSWLGICYWEKGQYAEAINNAKLGFDKLGWLYKRVNDSKSTLDNHIIGYVDLHFKGAALNLVCLYLAMGKYKEGFKILNGDPYINNYNGLDQWIETTMDISKPSNQFLIGFRIAGHIYGNNHSVRPFTKTFFEKAANGGDLEAKYYLGEISLEQWNQIEASHGKTSAAISLIRNYVEKKDYKSADYWWEKIKGKVTADTIRYYSGSNVNSLLYLLKKSAEAGDTTSQQNLAVRYYMGLDVPQDYQKAIKWFEMAASQKVNVRLPLASCYFNTKQYEKALPLLLEVKEEYPYANAVLGEMYYEGYLGTPDYTKAFKYFKKAEETNQSLVMYYLGMCFLKGNGVPKDELKGFEYMKKAIECKSVYVNAFWEISKCYRFGRGVDRDLKKAEYYEQEAEKAGNDDALWMKEQQELINLLEDNNPTKLQ